jgi:hypothetical protein
MILRVEVIHNIIIMICNVNFEIITLNTDFYKCLYEVCKESFNFPNPISHLHFLLPSFTYHFKVPLLLLLFTLISHNDFASKLYV